MQRLLGSGRQSHIIPPALPRLGAAATREGRGSRVTVRPPGSPPRGRWPACPPRLCHRSFLTCAPASQPQDQGGRWRHVPASGQQVWAQCGRPQRTRGGSEDRALEGDPDVQAVSGRDSSPARRPRPRPPSAGSAAQGAGRLWPQRVALRASTAVMGTGEAPLCFSYSFISRGLRRVRGNEASAVLSFHRTLRGGWEGCGSTGSHGRGGHCPPSGVYH